MPYWANVQAYIGLISWISPTTIYSCPLVSMKTLMSQSASQYLYHHICLEFYDIISLSYERTGVLMDRHLRQKFLILVANYRALLSSLPLWYPFLLSFASAITSGGDFNLRFSSYLFNSPFVHAILSLLIAYYLFEPIFRKVLSPFDL